MGDTARNKWERRGWGLGEGVDGGVGERGGGGEGGGAEDSRADTVLSGRQMTSGNGKNRGKQTGERSLLVIHVFGSCTLVWFYFVYMRARGRMCVIV